MYIHIIHNILTTFKDLLRDHWSNVNQSIRKLNFVQMKVHVFFKGDIIATEWNYIENIFKKHLYNHQSSFDQTSNTATLGEEDSAC